MTFERAITTIICCANGECAYCPRCGTPDSTFECRAKLIDDTIDLIKRQRAEIERLRKFFENEWENYLQNVSELVRANAIREFAKTYKDHVKNFTGMFADEGFYVSLDAMLKTVDFIEETLLKEGDK